MVLARMCICGVGAPALLLAATTKNSQPIWTIDLKERRFRGPRRGVVNDPGSLAYMAFSGGTVAVRFDQKAEEIPQKGTDSKTWLGWRLVGVFVGARTGQLLATRTGTDKLIFTTQLGHSFIPWARAALSNDGPRVAVLNGRKVSMYNLPAR